VTFYWVTLFAAIATSMAGQTLLKAGAGVADFIAQLFDWRTLIGLCLYGGAAVFYIVALRRIPMSRALPCTAISYVAAALIGHYAFGDIDWDEFHEVIKGHGPCNRDRMRTRTQAWDDGAWVREAATAHAQKRAAREAREAA